MIGLTGAVRVMVATKPVDFRKDGEGLAVRRRFYELAQAGLAPIASEALQRIADLYRIVAAIRGHDADKRRAARQEKSRPILEAMEPWLREKLSLQSEDEAR